jgi:hypothetical protein
MGKATGYLLHYGGKEYDSKAVLAAAHGHHPGLAPLASDDFSGGESIDVGKTHHWACVVDAEGKILSSVKVANDEAQIMALLTNTGSLTAQLIWAVDIIGTPSALLLALLARAGQSVRYASGRVVAAMSAALCRGG